jgi:beta-lactamase class A
VQTTSTPGGPSLTRRSLLSGAAAGLGLLATGCGNTGGTAAASRTEPTAAGPAGGVLARLADLERRFGGRLGVYAVDTGSSAAVAYRAEDRFLLCSTYKAFAVAAILRCAESDARLLSNVVPYPADRLVAHSPVTAAHVGRGLTVAELCAAAMTVSDNTAANLLVETLGGPPGVTRFLRTLGDPLTRLDRSEPTLNTAAPGDVRDTTSPRAAAQDLRALAVGDALAPASRAQFLRWLDANTTGGQLIRAGLPPSWAEGDRSGGGLEGETNDIAVVRPPARAPLVIAVYTAPADPASAAGAGTVSAAARIVAAALVPDH